MASDAVTPDEIREGLSAFFADVDPANLTSDEIKPEELSTASEFTAARQLDAADFIIDSMDVVDDVPVQQYSSGVTDAEGLASSPVTDISLDELQLVEPLAADTDLIDADYVSSLEDVFDAAAEPESSAEQVDADEDELDGQLDSASKQVDADEDELDGQLDSASEQVDADEDELDGQLDSASKQVDADEDELGGQLDSASKQVDVDEDELNGQLDSALESVADAETGFAVAGAEVGDVMTGSEDIRVDASDHQFSVEKSGADESEAVSVTDTSLDELQLVEPMAAESDLIDADYVSSLEDVFDAAAEPESSAEQVDADEDELDGQFDSAAEQAGADEDELNVQFDSAAEQAGADEDELNVQFDSAAEQADTDEDELDGRLDSASENGVDAEMGSMAEAGDYGVSTDSREEPVDNDMPAQENSSENVTATEITAASITVSARDVLHPAEPLAEESDLSDADYTSSLEDVVDEVPVDESSVESSDSDERRAQAESTLDDVATDGETDWQAANNEGGDRENASISSNDNQNDTPIDDLNLRDVVMKDGVDIDLLADDADSADAFDSTVDEQDFDGQGFVDAGTSTTDLDQSIQVVAGELQPVVNSALVVKQKSAEVADYYPVTDPLDSTQSDFDLDIPNAPTPGGFLRRWYIRGAAFLKRMWRRIRPPKTDARA